MSSNTVVLDPKRKGGSCLQRVKRKQAKQPSLSATLQKKTKNAALNECFKEISDGTVKQKACLESKQRNEQSSSLDGSFQINLLIFLMRRVDQHSIHPKIKIIFLLGCSICR